AQGFGEQAVGFDQNGDLTGSGYEHGAFHSNKIANVDVFLEKIEGFLTQFVDSKANLNFPLSILNMSETEFPHFADCNDPSRKADAVSSFGKSGSLFEGMINFKAIR